MRDKLIVGQTDRQVDGRKDVLKNRWTDGWMDILTAGQTDRQRTDRWPDGQTDRQTYGRKGKQTDRGQTVEHIGR